MGQSLTHGKRAMNQSTTTYVAMDTHKNTISVAIAQSGRRGEVRFVGEIPSRPDSVAKMMATSPPSMASLLSATKRGRAAMACIGADHLAVTAAAERTRTTIVLDYGHENHKGFKGINISPDGH
jgi:hypothetical protein